MNQKDYDIYEKYSKWTLDYGVDMSMVEVNEDNDVFVAQINEDGTKMIPVPAEFEDIALLVA